MASMPVCVDVAPSTALLDGCQSLRFFDDHAGWWRARFGGVSVACAVGNIQLASVEGAFVKKFVICL